MKKRQAKKNAKKRAEALRRTVKACMRLKPEKIILGEASVAFASLVNTGPTPIFFDEYHKAGPPLGKALKEFYELIAK